MQALAGYALTARGIVCGLRETWGEAAGWFRRASEVARVRDAAGLIGPLLLLEAECHLQAGDWQPALAAYAQLVGLSWAAGRRLELAERRLWIQEQRADPV